MPKKKFLITDPITGKLSRLKAKDLPLVEINGLDEGDPVAPFGDLESDLIEYCLYTTDDDYIASGEIRYPLPENLDVGQYVRNLGYNRGTYKIVFNFLREIGGSTNDVLVKKSDKSIYTGEYMIDTNGKILAASYGMEPKPDILLPILDDNGNEIELIVAENKYWIQEVSPSRTEIRLRPNPAIDDPAYYEQFRLLGYTCLSYSDISGESYITFIDDTQKNAKINVPEGQPDITLNELMAGGTLIIRDAFIVGWDDIPEQLSRYGPVIETEQFPIDKNLVTNGHFADLNSDENGNDVVEKSEPDSDTNHDIIKFDNPGHSTWVLETTNINDTVDPENGSDNNYCIELDGITGETYIMSCWVHWTAAWPEDRRGLFGTSEDPFNGWESDSPVETKIVNGNIWYRHYKRITPDVNTEGNIKWNLGKTTPINPITPPDPISCKRYITDIQYEEGSTVSFPTPYMEFPRTEETDVPVTGLITFTDGDTVKATLSDGDGFVEEMVSDGGDRGSGRITIKNAVVIDEEYNSQTKRTIIDNIPIENTDNSIIRESGYETEFHQSPFHGSTPIDAD
jgi:hypothetical protein